LKDKQSDQKKKDDEKRAKLREENRRLKASPGIPNKKKEILATVTRLPNPVLFCYDRRRRRRHADSMKRDRSSEKSRRDQLLGVKRGPNPNPNPNWQERSAARGQERRKSLSGVDSPSNPSPSKEGVVAKVRTMSPSPSKEGVAKVRREREEELMRQEMEKQELRALEERHVTLVP